MKAVVTGGGGFVGRAVVQELLARGDDVLSISRGAHPELEVLGARTRQVDLADAAGVADALRGAEVVFHVAAKAGVWGKRADYRRTNVDGTLNVLDAAVAGGVRRLVFTSSPSVCFDGRDHVSAGNDLLYARRFLAPYPETKAEAERIVLAANGEHGLATVALRPHLVFGPGDPHLVPRLLARARARRLAVVGRGDNEVSMTYVENAAHAHICAAEGLEPGARHAGRAYFIAQEEPVRLWDWVAELLRRVGAPPLRGRIPAGVAKSAGAALEGLWTALPLSGEPPLTRFVAAQLSTSHSYDLGPARRDLGYRERVTMAEATERLVESIRRAP